MRCIWAGLVTATVAAAQNEAVAALVAKYKKSAGGSSTPAQRPQRTLAQPPQRTFHARRPAATTAGDAHADVAAYFRGWRRAVPHCAPLMQGSCVYVSDNGGILHARDMSLAKNAGSSKQMLSDLQLRAVSAALLPSLPANRWLSWNMVYTAAGPTKPRPWPTFAIGKREPHRPGLLMPNPFFGAPSWWARHNLMTIAASAKRRWATRAPRVLYRGACGPGARARLELMNVGAASELLDVGFTGVDGFPSIQACVDALAKKHGLRVEAGAARRASHVAQTNYSQYRYLLHLPGAATGSYSRNLQSVVRRPTCDGRDGVAAPSNIHRASRRYLWTHGSIVLMWNQTATEFYYRHLRNDVHYVVVDATSIADVVAAIEADPARQARLRTGARAFYDAHLAAPRLVDRWRAAIDALALRQDVDGSVEINVASMAWKRWRGTDGVEPPRH